MAKEFNQGLKTALKLIAYLDDNEAQNEKDSYRISSGTGWFRYRSASRPKDNTWYTGAKLGWSSTMTLVSTATVTRMVSAMVRTIKINWVLARSWVTRRTNTWASSWAMTGLAVCLTKAA